MAITLLETIMASPFVEEGGAKKIAAGLRQLARAGVETAGAIVDLGAELDKVNAMVSPVVPFPAPPPSPLAKFAEGVITTDNLRSVREVVRDDILHMLWVRIVNESGAVWMATAPASIAALRNSDNNYRTIGLIGGEQFSLRCIRLGAKKNLIGVFEASNTIAHLSEYKQFEVSSTVTGEGKHVLFAENTKLPFHTVLAASLQVLEGEDWIRQSLSGEDILTAGNELFGSW